MSRAKRRIRLTSEARVELDALVRQEMDKSHAWPGCVFGCFPLEGYVVYLGLAVDVPVFRCIGCGGLFSADAREQQARREKWKFELANGGQRRLHAVGQPPPA